MVAFAANCSTLFRDHPFPQRFERARLAGFTLVECWWPFAAAVPPVDDVRVFVDAVTTAGVDVACMNLFAGDLAAGERGILNDPARVEEFRGAVTVAATLGAATGCRCFNALYGLDPAPPKPAWTSCAMDNLKYACDVLATVEAEVLVEPLCRNSRYGLRDPAVALAAVRQVRQGGCPNAGVLADLYQLAVTGQVEAFVRTNVADIRHVQVADDPGRGAPGTGALPIADWLAALADSGYPGVVGLEYYETVGTDPFDWLSD